MMDKNVKNDKFHEYTIWPLIPLNDNFMMFLNHIVLTATYLLHKYM